MAAFEKRSTGTLLHVTALPSKFGIGDLGPYAYRFVDILVEACHCYWQVLPLNPTTIECGNSPYTSESGYAGNPLFISPEGLVEEGLIENDLSKYFVHESNLIEYAKVEDAKKTLLRKAYATFSQRKKDYEDEYREFEAEQSGWLEDYALYKAIWETTGLPWYCWPSHLRGRDVGSLKAYENSERVRFHKFIQFMFFRQWARLKEYCGKKGVKLIGDLPYYVGYDSADVWANANYFKLGTDKKPSFLSGVPPDYFSANGQLWGHPVYDWERLKEDGFSLWMNRIGHNLKLFDVLRIDHFRGLLAYWEVPAHETTAVKGNWVLVPSDLFLNTLSRIFPSLPFIAEDLGMITEDVNQAMKRFSLPGMRVLTFGFDGDPKNIHLPRNHSEDSVAYTGTHDTNTARGWFNEEASEKARSNLFEYVGSWVPEEEVSWTLMKLASGSRARLAVFPIQDILSLGSESRMNRPGMAKDNYLWKLTEAQLGSVPTMKLKQMATESSRL
jgi:4-alpha-glucanotransferase